MIEVAPASPGPTDARPIESRRRTWLRLGLLALVIGGAIAIGLATGITDHLTTEAIRDLMVSAGLCGILVFLGAFAAGSFLQVPGMVFVAAGIIAYGKVYGGLLALAGAIFAVSFSFCLVRWIGGMPLATVQRPLMRKILSQLERRPVRTIVILRTIFMSSPPVNYALALSSVRYRDYFLGSALGLIVPVAGSALLFDVLFR